ncbi:P-loop containing nucleoside triphosphate hydrolase protein [Xylaria intraflava]|nr:P-loop containing nucleoside triphosphate hydrolase protein [Xylaria intraflava]
METSNPTSCEIVFVLGPPGSGKGTLCKAAAGLAGQYRSRILHLSVGDYLRELCNSETSSDTGYFDTAKIRDYLKESKLLPANVLIPVLKHKIESTPNWNARDVVWLVDGFPRNMETTRVFEDKIGKPGKVIVLECSRGVAQGRFLSRAREKADDERRFDKRYAEYVDNMKALREHYASVISIVHVDASPKECRDAFIATFFRKGDKV